MLHPGFPFLAQDWAENNGSVPFPNLIKVLMEFSPLPEYNLKRKPHNQWNGTLDSITITLLVYRELISQNTSPRYNAQSVVPNPPILAQPCYNYSLSCPTENSILIHSICYL